MRHRRLLHATLVASAAAGVAVLLVLHGPNWGQVGYALATMAWSWALAAVGLNLVSANIYRCPSQRLRPFSR
jgi:hypothetical protein